MSNLILVTHCFITVKPNVNTLAGGQSRFLGFGRKRWSIWGGADRRNPPWEAVSRAVVAISPDEPWEKQEDKNLAPTPVLLEGLCNSSRARAMCTYREVQLAKNTIKTAARRAVVFR